MPRVLLSTRYYSGEMRATIFTVLLLIYLLFCPCRSHPIQDGIVCTQNSVSWLLARNFWRAFCIVVIKKSLDGDAGKAFMIDTFPLLIKPASLSHEHTVIVRSYTVTTTKTSNLCNSLSNHYPIPSHFTPYTYSPKCPNTVTIGSLYTPFCRTCWLPSMPTTGSPQQHHKNARPTWLRFTSRPCVLQLHPIMLHVSPNIQVQLQLVLYILQAGRPVHLLLCQGRHHLQRFNQKHRQRELLFH